MKTRSVLLACGLLVFAGSSPAQNFRFTNVTASARFFSVSGLGGHGVQCADATGDDLPDIYVTNIFAPNEDRADLFFVNMGTASFSERGGAAGIADDGFYGRLSEESHAAVFADLDGDGDFDLFNGHTWSGNHKLYRNEGRGTFRDVSGPAGIEIDSGEPRGVAAGDINGDGIYDLVVSAWENQPMTLYLGRGGLRFERRSLGRLGAKLSSQGLMLTDFDGDSDLDIAVAGHTATAPIALLANDGAGNFRDVTAVSGIRYEGEGANGWSFGDLDGDADLDAVVVGKNRTRIFTNLGGGRFALLQELTRGNFTAALADFDHDGDLDIYIGGTEAVFQNDGSGRVTIIRDVGIVGVGLDGRGAAVLDFDGDGDMDIALASKRGDNTLFRNDINDSNWLRVKLVGPGGDLGAFGTKVLVFDERHVDDPAYLRGFREARGATGYCSQDEPILHFGLPGGRRYEVKAVFMDGTYYIAKGVEAPGVVDIDPAAPLR